MYTNLNHMKAYSNNTPAKTIRVEVQSLDPDDPLARIDSMVKLTIETRTTRGRIDTTEVWLDRDTVNAIGNVSHADGNFKPCRQCGAPTRYRSKRADWDFGEPMCGGCIA